MVMHAKHAKIKTKVGRARVSAKISHLAKAEPQMSPKQRIAMSLAMERAGQLGAKGGYKPKKGKKGTA